MEIITYLLHTFTFTKIKIYLTIIVGFIFTLMWWVKIITEALFILLIIDFVLGFVLAIIENKLNKKKMQLWLIKIVAYCITLIVLNYTNQAIMWANINWFWILEFGIAYLSLNEALSALRHLGKLWVPIPLSIINKLEDYKESLEFKDFKKWNE